MASNTKGITLKLVVDGGSKKVLYAEAKKDFIDFLIGLLQIPIGSIIALLAGNGLASGSLGTVLKSVSNLETSHFHAAELRESLLCPKVGQPSYRPPPLLRQFACWTNANLYSSNIVTVGHVKENCNYMVTDDLAVSPMSTVSVFALLGKFNIKDIGLLEEKTVKIDLKKGLELVKASMVSSTVLTDVFIPK